MLRSRYSPPNDGKLETMPKIALLLEGLAWDYSPIAEVENRYYTTGEYVTHQLNYNDPNSPSWRSEILLTGGTAPSFEVHNYGKPYRYDFTFIIDEAWPVDAATSMLVWQTLPVSGATYNGPNMSMHVVNGRFSFRYAGADGSPPIPADSELDLFPCEVGTYNISIRVKTHLTEGKIEIWREGQLIASAYNINNSFEVQNYYVKYGLYRWLTFTGSIKAKFSDMQRTRYFNFLG